MDQWDEFREAEDSINNLLGQNRLVIFFKKGDDLYGAPEESRIMFAKLKSEDDDIQSVRDEVQFLAMNLIKSLVEPSNVVMGSDDMDALKVVDRDEVVEALMKQLKKKDK
jgi:hypothetical protein